MFAAAGRSIARRCAATAAHLTPCAHTSHDSMIHIIRFFSSPSSTASSPPEVSLLPSQSRIRLPQLAPRMEHGRIARWLLAEGDSMQPTQVILEVTTNELVEDGSTYTLEVESHETGLLKKIIQQPSSNEILSVGTTIGIFEDPDWVEGDPPRGEFLWQAYVKEGAVRTGSCTPTREEEVEESIATPTTTPTTNNETKHSTTTETVKTKRKTKATTAAAAPSAADPPRAPTKKRTKKSTSSKTE